MDLSVAKAMKHMRDLNARLKKLVPTTENGEGIETKSCSALARGISPYSSSEFALRSSICKSRV